MQQNQDMGRNIGAFILIALGVVFLVGQLTDFDIFGNLWPMFVLLPGLAFLGGALLGGEKFTPMIFPGVIVTGTGGILLLQNVDILSWESWSYIWALYPGFVGIALMFSGARTGDREQLAQGRSLVFVAVLMLVVFGGFFELFIFGDLDFALIQYIVPVVLILGGLLLLFQGRRPAAKRKSKNEDWA